MQDYDTDKKIIVYEDDHLTLVYDDGCPYLIIRGAKYDLTSSPYEPCLYIGNGDRLIAVHNSFDPVFAVSKFARGETVDAVTGKKYGAEDFCRMLEFVVTALGFDTDISYAEGAVAVRKMIEIGATSPENAVLLNELGVRVISDRFSHSKKLRHRVMYTDDGRAYVRIRE